MKIIRPGLVSAATLRRFHPEAQVLGRLQNPGIAEIFEAGVAETDEGPLPYLVMQYIEGRPLLE